MQARKAKEHHVSLRTSPSRPAVRCRKGIQADLSSTLHNLHCTRIEVVTCRQASCILFHAAPVLLSVNRQWSLSMTSFPPLAAIFLTHFDDVKGQSVASYRAVDGLGPDLIEHSTLPSGLHQVESDLVLFTHHGLPGAAIFRSREDSTRARGRRMGTVGVVLGESLDVVQLRCQLTSHSASRNTARSIRSRRAVSATFRRARIVGDIPICSIQLQISFGM